MNPTTSGGRIPFHNELSKEGQLYFMARTWVTLGGVKLQSMIYKIETYKPQEEKGK